jgi:iron complex outermembrane recepter protein
VDTGLKLQQLFPGFLFASTISVLLAAPAFAQVIQVTGVRVSATSSGVNVILETNSDTIPQVSTTSSDKTLLTDIFNTQLRLPDGQAFRQDNPVEGIAAVTVTQQSPNTIRVAVTGTTEVPTVQLSPSPSGLVLSLSTPAATAQTPSTETPTAQKPQTQPPTTPEVTTPSEDKPEAPTAAPEPEEEIEIVVTGEQDEDRYFAPNASTATRTDTPIIDTPQSIQVIPQQILEDQQIIRVEDALRNVSGVIGDTESGGNGTSGLTIRGFRTNNGIPILRDGFRNYDNFSSPETANLEQIEVLKGPASILYGQLDPGGVINLVTKQPLSQPFYQFQFQAGNNGLIRPSLDISGPLTSDGNLLYRLNAVYQQQDGFRNFETDEERFFIAPIVTWKISDRTNLTFSLEYQDDRRPYDSGLVAFGNKVADVPYDRIFNEPDDFYESNYLNIGYNLEHRFSDNWTLRNAFRYLNQEFFLQTALPLFLNETTGLLNRLYAERDWKSRDYSLQTNVVGKFATGPVNHTLLTGVDLNWNFRDDLTTGDFTLSIPINIFNPVYRAFSRPSSLLPLPGFDTNGEIKRFGVYLQDQISFGDRVILLAGFRYDTVDFRSTNNTSGQESRNYDDAFTPRVGLVYKPTENVSLYGSYARSFTPNFGLDVNRDFLEPEKAEGFEAGVKAELLNGNLFATLAYFDITKQNVATADPINPFASVATGEQRSRGVELDVTGQILPGWNIIASYAYTDAEVTKDNKIPVGTRLPGAPEHSASLWTTYQIQSGNLQGLGFGLGVNYVGSRFGDLQNTFEVGDYFLTNAAIFYRRNNWRIGLNLNNLFDVNYISAVRSSSRTTAITPGEPFSIVGSISVEF